MRQNSQEATELANNICTSDHSFARLSTHHPRRRPRKSFAPAAQKAVSPAAPKKLCPRQLSSKKLCPRQLPLNTSGNRPVHLPSLTSKDINSRLKISDLRTYESDSVITQTLQRLSGQRTAQIRLFALSRRARSQPYIPEREHVSRRSRRNVAEC